MSMLFIGLLTGLGAAVCQTASYVFSRLYVQRCAGSALGLVLFAHLAMGAACAAMLPFLRPGELPALRIYLGPLVFTSGFYLAGQVFFFLAMRRESPSRVVPLLGLKIIILALLSVLVSGSALTLTQWLAVSACAGATLALNEAGGRLRPSVLLLIAATCSSYAVSDLNIARLVKALEPLSPLRASVMAVCLCYLLLGVVALLGLPWLGGRKALRASAPYALPFAAFWIVGAFALFGSIACIGPVYAVILQSTRGIMTIAVGAWIGHLGHAHLEHRISRGLFVRRVLAATLMVLAIWLYKA